jgi:hypothetical protein
MAIDPVLVEFDRHMYRLACVEFKAECGAGFSRIAKIRSSETYCLIETLHKFSLHDLQKISEVLPKRVRRWLMAAEPSFFSVLDKKIVEDFLERRHQFWPNSTEYLRMSEDEVKLEMDGTKKPLARHIRQVLAEKVKNREFGFKDRDLEPISAYEVALNKQIGKYELCTLVDIKKPFAMTYHNEVTNEIIGTNALPEDFMVTLGIAGPVSWRYTNEDEAMMSFEQMMQIAGYFAKKMEMILAEIQGIAL